jgi:hypothetical protein
MKYIHHAVSINLARKGSDVSGTVLEKDKLAWMLKIRGRLYSILKNV